VPFTDRALRILYQPRVNAATRGVLRPFRRWLPMRWRIPVNGIVSVELPGGQTVRLAANPTSHLARMLYWDGYSGYEPYLFDVFLPLVARAGCFVDVGAALGYYALAGAITNPRAHIVAFEPTPGTFAFLETNIRLNGAANVVAERLALSDAPGDMDFFITTNPKFPGMPQLAGTSGLDSAGATRPGTAPERVAVTVDTLDRYAEAELGGRRIDLLKLDTEATEDRVLRGARRVLTEHRPIILCEVLPGRIEEAIELALDGMEYAFARATPAGMVPVDHLRHGHDGMNDYVMIPAERRDELRSLVSSA
jgi:FkbM family methyltransferase